MFVCLFINHFTSLLDGFLSDVAHSCDRNTGNHINGKQYILSFEYEFVGLSLSLTQLICMYRMDFDHIWHREPIVARQVFYKISVRV